MKILLFGFFLSGLVYVAFGATAIELHDNSTDHPGHCYSKTKNVGAMEKGEVKTLKDTCVQATCADDRSIAYYSCGTVMVQPECKLVEDLKKSYPDCCPQGVCP